VPSLILAWTRADPCLPVRRHFAAPRHFQMHGQNSAVIDPVSATSVCCQAAFAAGSNRFLEVLSLWISEFSLVICGRLAMIRDAVAAGHHQAAVRKSLGSFGAFSWGGVLAKSGPRLIESNFPINKRVRGLSHRARLLLCHRFSTNLPPASIRHALFKGETFWGYFTIGFGGIVSE